MMLALALLALICAAAPALMFYLNLRDYIAPVPGSNHLVRTVSILIPARNEEHAIGDAVRCILRSCDVEIEVVVMDDGSTDATKEIVLALAASDNRVRLEQAPALPPGWNGKQHACWALARSAQNPVLCFVDADVRLEPECIARMVNFLHSGGNGLVSGFPRQVTKTFLEWMLLPLIHFVLLGFLPFKRMRGSTDPAFAAGCGQFMMVRAEDYFTCGGHSGIKLTMHDGLRLPRLFREAGFRTDLADLTGLAHCRMYTSAAQVWSGLAKNATEGLGAPARLVPVTLLLLIGQVVPFLLLGRLSYGWVFAGCVLLACLAAWIPRLLGIGRFRQDSRGAILHPIGILLLLAVQWAALLRKLRGGSVSWRGRAYADK